MREIRTSGSRRGETTVLHGIRILRHIGETLLTELGRSLNEIVSPLLYFEGKDTGCRSGRFAVRNARRYSR